MSYAGNPYGLDGNQRLAAALMQQNQSPYGAILNALVSKKIQDQQAQNRQNQMAQMFPNSADLGNGNILTARTPDLPASSGSWLGNLFSFGGK